MGSNLFKSIAAGCIFSVVGGTVLFSVTCLDVLEIAAWITIFFVAGTSITGSVLEELANRRSTKRRHRKAKSLTFVTLNADEWYSRYKNFS